MKHEYRILYRDSQVNLHSVMIQAISVTEALSKLEESESFVIESINLSRSDIENVDNA